jgi:O-antigen/teichoic acid export membrane protein
MPTVLKAVLKDETELSWVRFRRLGGELLWVALGQVLAALGAMVGVRLLTQTLPPQVYGEVALGITLSTLAQQVLFGPQSAAFLRFFASAREGKQLGSYLLAMNRTLGQATLMLGGFCAVMSLGLWLTGNTQWLGLASGAVAFSLLTGCATVFGSVQTAARHRVIVALHDGLAQWLRFFLALLLITLWGASSGRVMWGFALASAVVLGSQWMFFRLRIVRNHLDGRAGSPVDTARWEQETRRYAWPFAAWGLFTWAQMASDRWALQTFASTSSVGFYAVLYQLGYYPINLLSGLLVQLVSPVVFSRVGSGADGSRAGSGQRLNELLLWGSLLFTALITLLAFLFHAPLFAVLVGPEYRAISPLLPWLVLAGGLFACGQVAVLPLLSETNTQALVAPKIVTALLGIGLNLGGAFWLGLRGVVFAGTAFAAAYFLWVVLLAKPAHRPLHEVKSSEH